MIFRCERRFRDIPPKETSVSGRIVSSKYKAIVEYESTLERDLIYLMEFSEDVFRYMEQPLFIPYIDAAGISRNYYPDFYVEYLNPDRPAELIEVKYENDLEEQADVLRYKFEAARKFCEENNMVFRVISEREIRGNNVYLDNLHFLGGYKNALLVFEKFDTLLIETTHYGAVIDHIDTYGPISVREAVRAYSEDSVIRAQAVYEIWTMIARGTLFTDLNVKLTLDSIIWR